MAARARESCWCFGGAPQQARNGLCSPAPSDGRASTPLPSVLRKIEKWGDYEAVGGLIKVTGGAGFVPMKTPLTRAQMASLKKSGKRIRYPHDLQGFVRDQASQGRRVGLVIDLTCHDCLYASELKLCPGVRYVHLATEAKKVLEPWLVERIADEARGLWKQDPKAVVAIHCSYGFNRTGFALCSYLVTYDHMAIDDALAIFEQARPPGVKHGHFSEELRARFPSRAVAPSPVQAITPRAVEAEEDPGSLSEPASLSGTPTDASNDTFGLQRCKPSSEFSPLRTNGQPAARA